MDDMTTALVDEVLTLHAEVAALRLLLGAPLSSDPYAYFDELVSTIDAVTLPLAMSEDQREIVKARLEYTRKVWMKYQAADYPGGWRGVQRSFGRLIRRLRRVIFGVDSSQKPIPSSILPFFVFPK